MIPSMISTATSATRRLCQWRTPLTCRNLLLSSGCSEFSSRRHSHQHADARHAGALAWNVIGASKAPHSCVVLHGLLGSKNNWRQFCKKLTEDLPNWNFVVVDLRGHGDSPAKHPPHTIRSCATDLAELVHSLPGNVNAILGHSLGGKILLEFLRTWAPSQASAAFIIDSQPGAWDQRKEDRDTDSVSKVFELLHSCTMQPPFHSRQWVHQQFIEAGFSDSMAAWMCTNLKYMKAGHHGSFDSEPELHWKFDINVARQLFESHMETDSWDVLMQPCHPLLSIDLVAASRSSRWKSPRTRAKLDQVLAQQHAESENKVTLNTIPSGHWVHVDNPTALKHCVVNRCRRLESQGGQ